MFIFTQTFFELLELGRKLMTLESLVIFPTPILTNRSTVMNLNPATPMEVWNWYYNLSMFLAAVMLISAQLVRIPHHDLPLYIKATLVFGIILAFGFPYNILVFFSLIHFIAATGAPVIAVVMATFAIISAWGYLIWAIVGPIMPRNN